MAGVPWEWEKARVKELLDQYELPRDKLETIMGRINNEFDSGLNDPATSSIKMFPTYVRSTPDGSEQGDFFALDLGGTNFRVLLVQIHNNEARMSNKIYPISKELMIGTGEALFDYIADSLVSFAKEKLGKDVKKIPSVGFTFSFPVSQTSLVSGKLVKWTKGFKASDVVDHDIGVLLQKAIKRNGKLEIGRVALLNDTTGVLMSCAFDEPNVEIATILGTGSNACYMERDIKKVKTMNPDDGLPQVIINTEWGAFSDLKNVATPQDDIVDKNSLNPGEQIYEKMISGMYLGEIVRLCILDLVKKFVLFRGHVSQQLNTYNSFQTAYVSDFCSGEAQKAVNILSGLGYESATLSECNVIQEICMKVSLRAARLAAAGLAVIVRRINKPNVTVAVDGSLIKKHPKFKQFMYQTLDELLPSSKIKIKFAEDGSGRGAALVAAVAERLG